ncbi:hypothetical protein [Mycobacterium sp. E2479]|uniref:hypothetical protein n=1 Tax=Mycobacterium sp. E2479 TaxID=1834134 RepID=UPI000AF1B82D|nr:hypothetical protein [Mycobacterium sp. E2479]
MSAEEPETAAHDATEASASNDATGVIGDDFSTRSRNVAGRAEPLGKAWSDEDDTDDHENDDAQPERHSWSVVTGHAAALISVGAAVAAITVVVGVVMFKKDHATPPPADNRTAPPGIATTQLSPTTSIAAPPSARTATTPPESAPVSHTALPACYDSASVAEKPSTAGLLCKGHWFENLTWSSWGPDAADGAGFEAVKGCTPSCAEGELTRNRVEVHFSGPASPPADSGCPADIGYYTQLIVAYPTSTPPQFATGYEGAPISEKYNGIPSYRWNGLIPHCY